MYRVLKKILKITFNCHQIPERSFFIAGHQFPLCARCTGILTGILVFPLFIILKIEISIILSIFFMIPLVLDGGVQLLLCRMSNNLRRFLTGVLFALGLLYLAKAIIKIIINQLPF